MTRLITAAVVAASATVLSAQAPAPAPQRLTGPVIQEFGATFTVPTAVLVPPTDIDYKLAFDVNVGEDDPKRLNARIDTLARFINMHARAGVPLERIKLALVLHGTAAKDTLTNAGYRARHGVDNPNLPLLDALKKAGVRIYLCGQSAGTRQLGANEIAPMVTMAYSAMTAHVLLAREGYVTNPF
jgi:intracellular sulfur oxidation DsrE/DsrF family protein